MIKQFATIITISSNSTQTAWLLRLCPRLQQNIQFGGKICIKASAIPTFSDCIKEERTEEDQPEGPEQSQGKVPRSPERHLNLHITTALPRAEGYTHRACVDPHPPPQPTGTTEHVGTCPPTPTPLLRHRTEEVTGWGEQTKQPESEIRSEKHRQRPAKMHVHKGAKSPAHAPLSHIDVKELKKRNIFKTDQCGSQSMA